MAGSTPTAPSPTIWVDCPPWSASITPRQLAHHASGLPPAGQLEARLIGDWTEAFVLEVLGELTELPSPPGAAYSYSNAGYVLLARIIAEASGMPLAAFAAQRLFQPLGIDDIGFITDFASQLQTSLLGRRLPLTHGDGGLWSSARAFAQWLDHQNRDTLGLAALVETAGRLNDRQSVDYGWGLGLREYQGTPLLIHGGGWTGAAAKTVRSRALGIAVIGLAAESEAERVNDLVTAVLTDAS